VTSNSAVLREKGLPHMRDHPDHLEQLPSHQHMIALSLTDDVFLRSFNWARWQLSIT
jgi:hypothetical protein